jgi:hypothetical protein
MRPIHAQRTRVFDLVGWRMEHCDGVVKYGFGWEGVGGKERLKGYLAFLRRPRGRRYDIVRLPREKEPDSC